MGVDFDRTVRQLTRAFFLLLVVLFYFSVHHHQKTGQSSGPRLTFRT